MKKDWIYEERGLAIIAVVACHQYGVLHYSQTLQLLSLYSVTVLIFLMGVTKTFSIKKHFGEGVQNVSVLAFSVKSMIPVLCAYIVASYVYSYGQSGNDYNILWTSILSFSADGPLYFIQYYILLSLWGPIVFSMVKYVYEKNCAKAAKAATMIFLYAFIFIVGYLSIDRLDIFGQSFLFVYSVGLMAGLADENKIKKIYVIPGLALLILGGISTARFYAARLAGDYHYNGGINFLTPKLQMTPPNLSIIAYSFGVIAVAYFFFQFCSQSSRIGIRMIGKPFRVMGKYSMDIYLWHRFVQLYINPYFYGIRNVVLKWLICYALMLGLPIIIRYMYTVAKKKMYEILAL